MALSLRGPEKVLQRPGERALSGGSGTELTFLVLCLKFCFVWELFALSGLCGNGWVNDALIRRP